MSQTESPDLSKLVGGRIRILRGERSQEEVAEAARGVGLSWTRSVVASIENGHRSLRLDEFLVLPVVFRRLDIGAELLDLLPLRGRVKIEGGTWNVGTLRKILDEGLGNRPARVMTLPLGKPNPLVLENAASILGKPEHPSWIGVVLKYARGEAEQKAARKYAKRGLDVEPFIIATAAYKLWGRGLTQERDARLGKVKGSKRSLQARRGRITRELLSEIDGLLREADWEPRYLDEERPSQEEEEWLALFGEEGETDGERHEDS